MYPISTIAGYPPVPTTEKSTPVNPNGATKMQLLHEALSRARMRRPQAGHTTSSEAPRSARRVAMEGRRTAARELGVY
jgi:hypothetical protein